jgi:hypothetical protein
MVLVRDLVALGAAAAPPPSPLLAVEYTIVVVEIGEFVQTVLLFEAVGPVLELPLEPPFGSTLGALLDTPLGPEPSLAREFLDPMWSFCW